MKKRGFTLVEIMIVVAIIALLAAIAIPNLLGARKTANEAAAKANIKVLCTEAETYAAGTGDGAYYATLAAFQAASTAASNYCGTTKGGYIYACTMAPGAYSFTATPVSINTGSKVWTGIQGGQITETAYVAP